MPGNANFVEVWNEAWTGVDPAVRTKNEDGLALWYQWLNEGRRLIATAGSDTHGPASYGQGPGFNVVYAEALSEPDILAALCQGHLYLSAGPGLTLTAQTADGVRAMMGDSLPPLAEEQAINLTSEWDGCPTGATLSLIVDGQRSDAIVVAEHGRHSWTLSAGEGNWGLVELRGQDNAMLALTNPIYMRP